MFSIIIPTWNNLDYLKNCVASIRKNSAFKHQVILHVNEGSDGSLIWAKENDIEFTCTDTNVGICVAVNQAAVLAKYDYIVYMNDDMYVCPGWDKYLMDDINVLNTDCFMLSSTMIESKKTSNDCVIVQDFGDQIDTFREDELLIQYNSLEKADWNGSSWPPTVVSKKYWFITGGYSVELSPGMSSDDFSRNYYKKRIQDGLPFKKAVLATAHKLLRIIFAMLTQRTLFRCAVNS